MKRLKKLIALLLVITSALLLLASCGKNENVDRRGEMKLVIEYNYGCTVNYEEFDVPLKKLDNYKEGLVGVLEYLKKEESLKYELTESQYGKYITSIADLKEDPKKGRYIIVYTSVEEDFSTAEGAKKIPYYRYSANLVSSGVGISSMNIKKDSVVLLRLETYE